MSIEREVATGEETSPNTDGGSAERLTVVGIGGSAGALGSLMALLEELEEAPVAIVVVLHLAPDHESHAVEILQRVTPMKVTQVVTRTRLQAGHVYVLAPGMNLITDDGHVQPARTGAQRPSFVIDLFFRTLAEVHREHAIGIVLSGTGRDGSLGLAHIKENGGLTIAQLPEDSEHADMPLAAIQSGNVDLVLSGSDIGSRLAEFALDLSQPEHASAREEASKDRASRDDDESAERAFHDILASLRVRTRHDFRHYKRATLMRRLERRMQIQHVSTIHAYRDLVRRNPEELIPLLADFLISVTNFFRDGLAFEAMQRDVLGPVLQNVQAGEELRVWVPACASGEEAYSIAMLLQEQSDLSAQPPRVQVFASDINEAALSVARAGVYPSNITVDVNESRLMAFFEKEDGGRYRVRTAVREMIVFAHHNVLGDPPFSRLDLICCRNLLIYLDRTAQAAALDMFAYALKPGGYLFLGNAESIDASGDAFQVVNKEHRIYRLRPDAVSTMRARIPSQLISPGIVAAAPASLSAKRSFPQRLDDPLALVHERALIAASPPSVLITADADIERVSPGAARFVGFGEGVPTRNLLNNLAPDVRVELRAALFRANESQSPVRTVFHRAGDSENPAGSTLALSVFPAGGSDGSVPRYLVLFDEPLEDLTSIAQEPGDDGVTHLASMRRLEDENRALKLHLQETLDRSAVSNEELKASNEELQAINEELRSAKEELETSKEELQSVNEELTTVNFELRMKVDEAGRNNDDLRNLMEASDIATIFVDAGLRVKRFTPRASKLFALIASDIGRPLMDVKSRLHYDEIADDAASVFKRLLPVERSVSSIDDEHYFARILPYRTSQDKIGGAVLTFVNVTELRRAEDRVRATEERLLDAIATNKDFAVISTDIHGVITSWNEGAMRSFGYEPGEIIGRNFDVLFTAGDVAAGVPRAEREEAARDGRASDERYHMRKDGSTFYVSGVLTPLHSASRIGFVKIARDASDERRRQESDQVEMADARREQAAAKATLSQKDQFLAVVSHELKQPLNLMQLNSELLTRLPETRQLANVQRIAKTMMQAITAQSIIVNDLLDLSRAQTGKMRLNRELTDLSALVIELGRVFEEEARGRKIELKVEAPDCVVCDCDPVRMEQVIWNLLGNALKFTDEGGRIVLDLAVVGPLARLIITDTGIGIAPANLPRIFDIYEQGGMSGSTSGKRRSGLGIGLALVKELVEAHGGTIRAESAGIGSGSTFTLEIAMVSDAAVQESPVVEASLSVRVLMVDDSEDDLSAFAMLLRLEGARVDATTDAAEALELLKNGHYDLVLSDIGMPGMSGLQFMQRARAMKHSKRFKSIAISGYGSESDKRGALQAGFDGHLSKPVSIQRLRAMLVTFDH